MICFISKHWVGFSRPLKLISFQKQSLEVFFKKRCSYKFHKIHRKTPMSESLFTEHLWKTASIISIEVLTNHQSKLFRIFYYCITAQKMKFSIKDLFSKCDRIRSLLRIWSHLLKKSLMKNFLQSILRAFTHFTWCIRRIFLVK